MTDAPTAAPTSSPAAQLRSGRVVALGWVLTRAFVAVIYFTVGSIVRNDVQYYWSSLHAMFHGTSPAHTLREYPFPAIGAMLPQYAIVDARWAYLISFAGSIVLLDALFTWTLWRSQLPFRERATWFWVLFVPLFGQTMYFRFDLVPAVLLAWAAMCRARRPAVGGTLLGAAIAVKAWPLLVVPAAVRNRAGRWTTLAGVVAVGVVTTVVTVALGGWARVISPFTWQADRGLQIESIAATPLMVARRAIGGDHWPITLTYNAYQINGPGTSLMLHVATALTVVVALAVAVLWLRMVRSPELSASAMLWCSLVPVVGFIVTNKTLSPQYVVWIAGLTAVFVGTSGERAVIWLARGVLLAALLSYLVYPTTYSDILVERDTLGIGVLLLAARNVLLVAILVAGYRTAWRRLRPAAARPI